MDDTQNEIIDIIYKNLTTKYKHKISIRQIITIIKFQTRVLILAAECGESVKLRNIGTFQPTNFSLRNIFGKDGTKLTENLLDNVKENHLSLWLKNRNKETSKTLSNGINVKNRKL